MQHTVYLFDGFQLDVTRRKLVSSGGAVQPLNSRAMDVLLLLVASAGELIAKRQLMQTVWPNVIVEDNNLNQCILAIRKALGEVAGSNRYIMTVPGRGYRFVTPVHAVVQESLADTAIVAAPRTRLSQRQWLSLAAVICALLLVIVMGRHAQQRADPLLAGVDAAAAGDSFPAMVLRLREPPHTDDNPTMIGSTRALAQYLAARPDMKLYVQLRLMSDGGVPIWTGDYIASAQDVLALKTDSDAAAP